MPRQQRPLEPPVSGQEAYVMKGDHLGLHVLVKATNTPVFRRNGGPKMQQWLCQLINEDGVLGEQIWLEPNCLMALSAPTEELAETSCKPTTTSVITHSPARACLWLAGITSAPGSRGRRMYPVGVLGRPYVPDWPYVPSRRRLMQPLGNLTKLSDVRMLTTPVSPCPRA